MNIKTTGFTLLAGLFAATTTIGASSAEAINYTNTHLTCNFGGGKTVGVDVTTNPYSAAVTRIQYNTSPAFHAEQVWVMVEPFGKTSYSTITGTDSSQAVWGDGTTGSVPTSFGSAKGAGYVIHYGYDTLKIKIDETGQTMSCPASVAGNP